MNHIFISYSRREEAIVTSLAESLRARGFEVWQDKAGKRSGIPCSVKWFDAVEEAIFSASCALVIKSEAWDNSDPCSKEFQMIRQTALPYVFIDPNNLLTDGQAIVDEAADWCRQHIESADNGYRSWMVSGAYRLYKSLPIEAYTLRGGLIRGWRWMKQCKRVARAKRSAFQGDWTKSLQRFMRRTRLRLWCNTALRALLAVSIAVVVLWVPTFLEFVQVTQITNDTATAISEYTSGLRRVTEYDPVRAMRLAADLVPMLEKYGQDMKTYGDEEYFLQNQGDLFADSVSWEFLYAEQNRIYSDLLSRNYPAAFYDSAEDCLAALSDGDRVQTSSRYSVALSDDTAQVFVYDRKLDTTRQLLLDAVPADYCFNDTGDRLLLAAENKVYVYDLLGEAPPSLLSYNFEAVRELYYGADEIYAVTETGHVVQWDDPLPVRELHHESIAAGTLAKGGDGSVIAVYVDDGCLIRNAGNREDVYPLSMGNTVQSDIIAASSDGAYAAVLYRMDAGASDGIALVDLADGTVVQTYDTGCSILGYVFSSDDKAILATCSGSDKIIRIDLETGSVLESRENPNSYSLYNIIPYKDNILVCDTQGNMAVYNDALEQVSDYRAIAYTIQKQLAASEKYDCLLTAGRGGNTLDGFRKTWLSRAYQVSFVPPDGEDLISTTCVTVTASGDYAAYGNAGGSVYIWDVGAMELVWCEHSIPEAVVNMLFSDDGTALYVLGSSGTVYEVDVSAVAGECEPADPYSIWQMYARLAEENAQNMYRLGLAEE